MSATEIINDQMEKMRNELAVANQQIGVIMECIDLQEKILAAKTPTVDGIVFSEQQYKSLLDLSVHIHSACKRA